MLSHLACAQAPLLGHTLGGVSKVLRQHVRRFALEAPYDRLAVAATSPRAARRVPDRHRLPPPARGPARSPPACHRSALPRSRRRSPPPPAPPPRPPHTPRPRRSPPPPPHPRPGQRRA